MAESKENILVIKLGALGDFVQALGPMAAIRRHHPAAHITLLTTAPFAGFGKSCRYFDRVLVDEKPRWHNPAAWLRLRGLLRSGNFSRVYDLQNNDRTSFYFRLFGSPRPEWVGVARGASHRDISPQRTAGRGFEGLTHTLKLAGIDDVTVDDFSWIKGDLDRFALRKPYVLLVPGSSPQHPGKRWPADSYGRFSNLIFGNGFLPVILGAASEAGIASSIMAVCPQAVDLCGKTTLLDVPLLARHAAASLGNDTGPMHMIAATGCPSMVLFSRYSNPVRHAPVGASVSHLQSDDIGALAPEYVLERMTFRA